MIQTNNNDRRTTILICLFVIVFGVVFKLMPTFYYWQGQSSLKKENYVAARKYLKNFKSAQQRLQIFLRKSANKSCSKLYYSKRNV